MQKIQQICQVLKDYNDNFLFLWELVKLTDE